MPENLVSRDGFSRPVPRQPAHLHTQAGLDHDVFLSQGFQVRDELSDLGEVVSNEHLTSVILDALPEERYSKLKVQSIKDPRLRASINN